MLIARIDLPQQGNMEIDTDQEGQADDAQIGTLALGMTTLGKPAGVLGIEELVQSKTRLDKSRGQASRIWRLRAWLTASILSSVNNSMLSQKR